MSESLIRTTITMQKGIHAKGERKRKKKGHRNFSLYLEELVKADTGMLPAQASTEGVRK